MRRPEANLTRSAVPFLSANVLFGSGLFFHAFLYNFHLDGLGLSSTTMGHARGRAPLSVSLQVLGILVEFASNSRQAMRAVKQSFGIWRRLAANAPLATVRPVRVNTVEHDGEETGPRPLQMTWRCRTIVG